MADPITGFDKTRVDFFIDVLTSMLKSVAQQYGLDLVPERSTYGPNSLTFKVTFRTMTDAGQPGDFAAKAARVGLPSDCWGKTFVARGELYIVRDIKPRNRKYPVIADRKSDGSSFKWAVHAVRNGLQES